MVAKQGLLDVVEIMQSTESIAGMVREFAQAETNQKLYKAQDQSSKLYNQLIHERVMQETGINIKGKNGTGLVQCLEGSSGGNDTVQACPIALANNMHKKEFIVLAHNPLGGQSVSYAQVKLPNKQY